MSWPAESKPRRGVPSLRVVNADLEHRRSAFRVHKLREVLGMTQRDFAYYLRVATNTVSGWETGKTLPSPLAEQAMRNLAAQEGVDLHNFSRFLG